MYQICPHCNGSGIEQLTGTVNNVRNCQICNGEKIIHTESGLSPSKHQSLKEIKYLPDLTLTMEIK